MSVPVSEIAPIVRALGYIADLRFKVAIGLICAALVGAITTANAKVVQLLVDQVLARRDFDFLYVCVLLILGIQVAKGVFLFCSRYLMNQIGHVASFRIRADLYRHLTRLSLRYFHGNRTGDIISRLTNDVAVLQHLLMLVTHSIIDAFVVVFGVGFMFWVHYKLAIVTFVILPVLWVMVQKFSRRLRQIGVLMQQKIGEINSIAQETVLGMKEIQSFGMEDRMTEIFGAVNENNYRVNMKSTKYHALTQPAVELCHAAGMSLVIWYGSVSVLHGTLSPGALMQFLVCLGMIFHPIKKLTEVNNYSRQSVAAALRIFELVDEKADIDSKPGATVLDRVEGRVRFENVTFSYGLGHQPVIQDLSLEVEPGEVIAIVGQSGAGKSTLVNLIPRFYDVGRGAIRIDAHDIRDVELKSLRQHFGVVPQETLLFSGTIRENIGFSKPDATGEEIHRAAGDANALEFIERIPGGFEAQIGERGVQLSGGQRQRVAIARAILKDPEILILDEATSSLDSESETLVQEALERLMRGRTTFVIAHRLSTITKADRILVLEDGRIKELGSHDQLLRLRGTYHRLCVAQFKAA